MQQTPQARRRHFSGWRGPNLAGALTKIRLTAAAEFGTSRFFGLIEPF